MTRIIHNLLILVVLSASSTHADMEQLALEPGSIEVNCSTCRRIFYWHHPARPKMPTFVLVHGNADDETAWTSVIPDLLKAGCGVVAMEMPGQGRLNLMAKEADGYEVYTTNLNDNVNALLAVITDPKLNLRNVRLVGHSSGAAPTVFVANQAPQGLITGLHLLSPYISRVDGGFIGMDMAGHILPGLFRDTIASRVRKRGIKYSPSEIKNKVKSAVSYTIDLMHFDAEDIQIPPEIPVEIYYGGQDNVNKSYLVFDYYRDLKQKRYGVDNVEYHDYPNAGHYLTDDLPDLGKDLVRTVNLKTGKFQSRLACEAQLLGRVAQP